MHSQQVRTEASLEAYSRRNGELFVEFTNFIEAVEAGDYAAHLERAKNVVDVNGPLPGRPYTPVTRLIDAAIAMAHGEEGAKEQVVEIARQIETYSEQRIEGAKGRGRELSADHLTKLRKGRAKSEPRFSREEVEAGILKAASSCGHSPTGAELEKVSGITANDVAAHFGTFNKGKIAMGLAPTKRGRRPKSDGGNTLSAAA